jgi:hypothetical protein
VTDRSLVVEQLHTQPSVRRIRSIRDRDGMSQSACSSGTAGVGAGPRLSVITKFLMLEGLAVT